MAPCAGMNELSEGVLLGSKALGGCEATASEVCLDVLSTEVEACDSSSGCCSCSEE